MPHELDNQNCVEAYIEAERPVVSEKKPPAPKIEGDVVIPGREYEPERTTLYTPDQQSN